MSNLIKYIVDNGLSSEQFTGQVLWWSEKDGNGIMLVGEENHEVYFDRSVCFEDSYRCGDLVDMNFNTSIKDCACAKNVKLIK